MRKITKWLNWHVWPEKETIQSVYEIVLLLIVLGACLYIYIQMNTVKSVKFETKFACLDRNSKHSTISKNGLLELEKDSIGIFADANIIIPMTSIASYDTRNNPHNVSVRITDFKRNSPSKDTIFLNAQNEKWDEDTMVLKNNFFSIYPSKIYTSRNNKLFFNKLTLFYRNNFVNLLIHNPFVELFGDYPQDSLHYRNSTFLEKNDYRKDSITMLSYSVLENGLAFESRYDAKHNLWFWPFKVNIPLFIGNPGWFSLEDISQQYYDVKIKAFAIDSVSLKIDFCGASDFSIMSPEPDEKGMSHIIFYNKEKILQIINNGLRFHVKFTEMQNMQQIRLFVLTSIISGIAIIILVFFIIGIYKITKQYKISASIWGAFAKICIGIIIYTILYWVLLLKILSPEYRTIQFSNYIAIPVTLLLTWIMFNQKIRRKIFEFAKQRDWGKVIKVLSILTFISLLLISYYKISSKEINTMLSERKYGQATNAIYDSIMSKGVISKEDYIKLRRALSGHYNFMPKDTLDKDVSYNYIPEQECVLTDENNILNYYNLQNYKHYTYQLGPLLFYSNFNSYVYDNFIDGDRCYVVKLGSSMKRFTLEGRFIGTTNNGNSIVTKKTDILPIDTTETLYFYDINNVSRKKTLEIPRDSYTSYIVNFIDDFYWSKDTTGMTLFHLKNNKPVKKYVVQGGFSPEIENYRNHLYSLWNSDSYKFLSIDDSNAVCIDTISLSYIYAHGIGKRFKEKKQWNRNTIKMLKVLGEEKGMSFLGIDTISIYFYNNQLHAIETYDATSKMPFIKTSTLNIEKPDTSYSSIDKTYFISIKTKYPSSTVIIYNSKEKLFSIKVRDYKGIKGKYIVDKTSDSYVFTSITNPSDLCVIFDNDMQINYNYIEVIGHWAFIRNSDTHKSIVINLMGDNYLINRNKYLTNKQKKKLKIMIDDMYERMGLRNNKRTIK